MMAQIHLHQNNTKLCSSALEQALSSNFEVFLLIKLLQDWRGGRERGMRKRERETERERERERGEEKEKKGGRKA